MKRLAFSFAAIATLGMGACEKHSVDNLPEHYRHKGGQHADAAAGHETTPAHGEKAKVPAADHKG
jgi:hypothetical protein